MRSGARGFDARKLLKEYEKKIEDSEARIHQLDSEIEPLAIESETTQAVALQAELQTKLESMRLSDIDSKARRVLTGLGFKEAQLGYQFDALSGGWKMRCLLATALVQMTDILVLDEPTNYLDLLGILWLQHYLSSLKESSPDTIVVLVSHDRDFVNATCSETIILREKQLTYFHGNPASYEKKLRHETLRMMRLKESQERQIAHMEDSVRYNMQQGKKKGDDNKVRQAKSRQKKLDERMGMQVNEKGTRFKLSRDRMGWHDSSHAAIEVPREEKGVSMSFPPAPDIRFPGSLLSLEQTTFAYRGATKPTIQAANLVVQSGDRIGIVGLNGSGKSTLIKMLVEQIEPIEGAVTRHARVKIAYYSQHAVDKLKTDALENFAITALKCLMDRAVASSRPIEEPNARKLLGSLGLSGRTASETPLSKLSGR